MSEEQKPGDIREPYFEAQADMMDYWQRRWNQHMKELKKEIEEVIDEQH